METKTQTSILQMAKGAFIERVDYEMQKVIDNIFDPNTSPTAKRKITLTVELKPKNDRSSIDVDVTAKSALAPTNPVSTLLTVMSDENGEPYVAEMVPQNPGQIFLDGSTQESPRILNIANGGK